MKMMIDHIQAKSFVDGPGERVVLFMQGCPIQCPGCQSTHLWNLDRGKPEDVFQIAISLANLAYKHGNVTISGGEPFLQQSSLNSLIIFLRILGVKNILVYTGYKYESLRSGLVGNWFTVRDIFSRIDTLVDGPFLREQDHDLISWRGSSNQRPINMPETLKYNKVITHYWEKPTLTVTPEGDVLSPHGLSGIFGSLGTTEKTRMCGESK